MSNYGPVFKPSNMKVAFVQVTETDWRWKLYSKTNIPLGESCRYHSSSKCQEAFYSMVDRIKMSQYTTRIEYLKDKENSDAGEKEEMPSR